MTTQSRISQLEEAIRSEIKVNLDELASKYENILKIKHSTFFYALGDAVADIYLSDRRLFNTAISVFDEWLGYEYDNATNAARLNRIVYPMELDIALYPSDFNYATLSIINGDEVTEITVHGLRSLDTDSGKFLEPLEKP